MWPRHPQQKNFYPDLPLIENDTVVKLDPDQSQLTTWYTEHAVSFIERNREKPFFLYVAHSMPHVPLFVSSKFSGKTPDGLYGDVIAEIDWSVGRILETLRKTGLDDRTLVDLRVGQRPVAVLRQQRRIRRTLPRGKGDDVRGRCSRAFRRALAGAQSPKARPATLPTMTIDLLPTLAGLAGAPVSSDRIIDGRDAWPVIAGKRDAKAPHDVLYFYWGAELHAVRRGKWKLHLPHPYQALESAGNDGTPGKYVRRELELSLFDLDADVGETTNVLAQHPDVVKQLMEDVERAREDLGDALTKRIGKNVRPAGKM